jgi:hypothetical protein
MTAARDLTCQDCGVNTDYPPLGIGEDFGLRAEIWQATRGVSGRRLCVGCVEARLGRRLISSDFIPDIAFPDNRPEIGAKSARLLDRMGHHPRAAGGRAS